MKKRSGMANLVESMIRTDDLRCRKLPTYHCAYRRCLLGGKIIEKFWVISLLWNNVPWLVKTHHTTESSNQNTLIQRSVSYSTLNFLYEIGACSKFDVFSRCYVDVIMHSKFVVLRRIKSIQLWLCPENTHRHLTGEGLQLSQIRLDRGRKYAVICT